MPELIPLFAFVFYLIPFLIAIGRGLDTWGLVLALNLAIGWTGIGWLLVLWMASASKVTVPPHRPSKRLGG